MTCRFIGLDKETFHVDVGDRPPREWFVPAFNGDTMSTTTRVFNREPWAENYRHPQPRCRLLDDEHQSWFLYREVKNAS